MTAKSAVGPRSLPQIDLAIVWVIAIVVLTGYVYGAFPGPETATGFFSAAMLVPPMALYPLAWSGRVPRAVVVRRGLICIGPSVPMVFLSVYADTKGEEFPKGALVVGALAAGYLIVCLILRVSLDDLRNLTPWLTAGVGLLAGVWLDMPYMRWHVLAFTLFGLLCGAALVKMRQTGEPDDHSQGAGVA